MNNNINILAFGTFGNPNGFRQTIFYGNKQLEKVQTFDLNTNAIKLVPKSKMYAIRKEKLNNINIISFAVYDFAKEPNSEREGTFIGSSIMCVNELADITEIVKSLNIFHENLVSNNLHNSELKIKHSDDFSVIIPKNIPVATSHTQKINGNNFNNSQNPFLVVYTAINETAITQLFSDAVDVLSKFNTIYFTDSKDIITIVNSKKLFKYIDVLKFKEIQSKHMSDNNKVINLFEQEKKKIDGTRNTDIASIKNWLYVNESVHLKNTAIINEFKTHEDKLNTLYDAFEEIINSSINQVASNSDSKKIIELYNLQFEAFSTKRNSLKEQSNILPIAGILSNNKQSYGESSYGSDSATETLTEEDAFEKGNFISLILFGTTILFLLLWVITLIWFTLLKPEQKSTSSDSTNPNIEVSNTNNQPPLISEPIEQPLPSISIEGDGNIETSSTEIAKIKNSDSNTVPKSSDSKISEVAKETPTSKGTPPKVTPDTSSKGDKKSKKTNSIDEAKDTNKDSKDKSSKEDTLNNQPQK